MLNGIDVSSYQSGIDVSKIPRLDFCIVKATESNYYTNPYFYQQANNVLASGKMLGVYHFSQCSVSAVEEAKLFLKTVEAYKGRCFYCLDHETRISPNWALQFLQYVYKQTGAAPFIYLNLSAANSYNWQEVAANYPLWLACYSHQNPVREFVDTPSFGGKLSYFPYISIYQYTSFGRLQGYDSYLDLNKYYGDKDSLKKFYSKGSPSINASSTSVNNSYYIDDFGVKWIYENGKATLLTDVNLRYGANVYSNLIATLPKGTVVNYDAKAASGGYIWVRQPRVDGTFGYLAVGESDDRGVNVKFYATFS